MTIEHTSNLRQAGLHLEELARGLRGGQSNSAFRRAGHRIGKAMLQNVRTEINRFAKTQTPGTGLRDTFRYRVTKPRGQTMFAVRVTSDKPYARILDRGGVIRPRRARALTIPIHPDAKRRKARSFRRTFIRNGKIYQKRGNRIVALYVLKREVHIPPKFYLRKAARRSRSDVQRIMRGALRDLAKGIFRG